MQKLGWILLQKHFRLVTFSMHRHWTVRLRIHFSSSHWLIASVAAIRALLVLGTYCSLIGTGESGSKGIAYLSLTVQCCFQVREWGLERLFSQAAC